jgi:hypothetical protein
MDDTIRSAFHCWLSQSHLTIWEHRAPLEGVPRIVRQVKGNLFSFVDYRDDRATRSIPGYSLPGIYDLKGDKQSLRRFLPLRAIITYLGTS